MFVPSQAPQSQQMNFAAPPVTPQTTVKPLVPGTPPVLRNVEQYPQLTLGSQLYPPSEDLSLMRLFNETSEALGGLRANPVKKREGKLVPSLSGLTVGTSPKMPLKSLFSFVSLWTTVISVLPFKSRYNSPLATGMIKTRQSVR
ncbi:hypothetical protein RHMOL_Rhmol07G0072200 [Rhododendron molle]|uniref:Uncharacterized protein n=1 Tax=Rhododendron molle TaxID=49168 RepID=A0ACC0MYB6_RHOML|nr:hypothetical protein RHMOL_Rhmol07G0072200 [Rhododendron molle]